MKTYRSYPTRPDKAGTAIPHRRRRALSDRIGSRSHRRLEAKPTPLLRPPFGALFRSRPADDLPFRPQAFIFDVEGTLIDNVLPSLQCWSETLAEIGITASIADLHPYSGMDGRQMLRRFLKKHAPKLIEHIATLQSERYRLHYLPQVRPFPGVRILFAAIRNSGAKIALAASGEAEDFAHYRSLLGIDDLIDAACGGSDVGPEKPRGDLISLVQRRLRLPPATLLMIGDTPYDAQAARAAGVTAIGLQSGHFSRADLLDGGCAAVFFDLQALAQKLDEPRRGRTASEPAEDAVQHA